MTSRYPIDGLLGVGGNGLVVHLSYLIRFTLTAWGGQSLLWLRSLFGEAGEDREAGEELQRDFRCISPLAPLPLTRVEKHPCYDEQDYSSSPS